MHGNSQNQDGNSDGSRLKDPEQPSGAGSPAGETGTSGKVDELNTPQVKGHVRKLNLVGSSQITRAVAEAVRRGLSSQFVVTEAQLESAVKAIGSQLLKRLKANSKAVRGLPKDAFLQEVRADKQRIEAQREAARSELESLLEKLNDCQVEGDRQKALLIRESLETGRAQDQELTGKIQAIFESLESGADPETIRNQITNLTLGSMQVERNRAIEAQLADHRSEVDNFERRIAKLTQSLHLTEDELKRIASEKNIEIGVGSIYRTVQGLSSNDNKYETKKELMSSIFAANLELQKGHAEAS